MISVNLSASFGATVCHITWVDEKPCSNNSGGPLPPTRAKIRPALVLIHSEAYPGNRSARSGIVALLTAAALNIVWRCRWHVPALCHPPSPANKNQKRGSAMSIDFEIPAEAKA